MHVYYEKNQKKFHKELQAYLSPISSELEKETSVAYPVLFGEIWYYYQTKLLENFPYIGGDRSSGTKNLTGAYGFVAMGVICRKHGMTLERWGYLTTLAYQRFFEKIPAVLRKLAGKGLTHTKLVTKLLLKKDAENALNAKRNPGSFETQVQPADADYPIRYHMLVCPLAEFAKQYGYTEYMPYICNLDYVMFSALNVPFYREKTRASGDACCDFKLKPGAPVQPAWPCHAADENDPLK